MNCLANTLFYYFFFCGYNIIMMNYNQLIGSSLLDSYDQMINSSAQPNMFGGKRVRQYVLPGSTEYDYPGSLSVGQGDRPNTVSGGSFSTDFARRRRLGAVRRGGERDSDSDSESDEEMEGGKKFNLGKSLKSVGKALKPVSKVVMPIAKDALHEYIKSSMEGGKKKKSIFKSIGKALKPVGKELGRAGKEVFREVIVPAGKEALKEKLKRKPTEYNNEGGEFGGALIRDIPSQFQNHSYPPALASYKARPVGRGRSKSVGQAVEKVAKIIKCGGARSARGKIVSEVMKKHGLSLGKASAFVKAHNLY
jgi:hypothetical protein